MRALTLTLALTGCGWSVFGPDVVFVNRRPMDPVPPVYAGMYAEVERCLGARGDFGAVRWLVADSVMIDGVWYAGVLEFPDNVTMWSRTVALPWAVRHEMAHHITQIGDALHDEYGRVPCEAT